MPTARPEVESERSPVTQPVTEIASQPFGAKSRDFLENIEPNIHSHAKAVALLVLAGAFVVRVLAASGTYLNADEVIQYLIASRPTIAATYRTSLSNAHPPLHVLLLHLWMILGHSELALRLLSVAAGTASCWMIFQWVHIAFGRTAGWIALMLAAFTPALIAVSAEVRGYALLLLFMSAALYFLERAFQRQAARDLSYFSLCLYLAILSHYAAIFLAISAGIYALVRIWDLQPNRTFALTWVVGQIGGILLCVFQYLTHLSNRALSADVLQPYQNDMLRWGQEDLLNQTRYKASRMFLFLFEEAHISQAMVWIFAAGVLLLLLRELKARRQERLFPPLGFLLLVPFMALWAASLAGVYPFVESRHTIFLAPFIIAGASYAMAELVRRRIVPALLTAAILTLCANAWGTPLQPYIPRPNQDRGLMLEAVHELKKSVKPGELILVDNQTRFFAAYYLCEPNEITSILTTPPTEKFACGRNQMVSFNNLWKLTPRDLSPHFQEVVRTYGLQAGNRVWMFQGGWGLNLDTVLPGQVAKSRCLEPFGDNITIIPFVVGNDLLPAEPGEGCQNLNSAVTSN